MNFSMEKIIQSLPTMMNGSRALKQTAQLILKKY